MDDDQERILTQMNHYQFLIRQLISKMPRDHGESIMKNRQASNTIATGPATIWPCIDGWVVGIHNSFDNQIKHSFEIASELTMVELYIKKNDEFLLFYDMASKFRVPGKSFTLNPSINFSTNIIEFPIPSPEGTHLIGQYSKIIFVGKDHPNPNWPQDHSLFDLKYATEFVNLDGPQKAHSLITEFEALLRESKTEEELQIFLNHHPEFIFPDYEKVIIKPKFGSDFVADYAFSFRRHNGLQWIFVEIEKSSKKIFTKSDQFTSDFTQAETQIFNWEHFLDQNITYMQTKFDELYKPEFFLIYGRSSELVIARKNKLESKFKSSNNKYFRTYDDLLNNFMKVVQNLNKSMF